MEFVLLLTKDIIRQSLKELLDFEYKKWKNKL